MILSGIDGSIIIEDACNQILGEPMELFQGWAASTVIN
jgi:hypothetical protein